MITDCKRAAVKYDIAFAGEYVDDGWSGTTFARPDFERMISDVKKGGVNCIIVKDLSRLGRNYILVGQYLVGCLYG